jgi:hypothetical protein
VAECRPLLKLEKPDAGIFQHHVAATPVAALTANKIATYICTGGERRNSLSNKLFAMNTFGARGYKKRTGLQI